VKRLAFAYIIRRLLAKFPIVIGISVISFIIIWLLTPSDMLPPDGTGLLDIFMDHWILLLRR